MVASTPRRDRPRRTAFLDVVVDALSFRESLDACTELLEGGTFAQHVVVNAGKSVQAHGDPRLAAIIRNAEIVNADGQSVVWACKILGTPVPERVAGIDLMHALLERSSERGWRVFLLGAEAEVLSTAKANLMRQYPSLDIAGALHGFYDDEATVAKAIHESNANLLFIGMPSPRKEFFVEANREALGPVLAFGVGGSFDVLAGVTSRAPSWMQRAGLEWLYRLIQEPRRMWRRYLYGNTRFVWLVARAAISRR